jgi:hypothetical protein
MGERATVRVAARTSVWRKEMINLRPGFLRQRESRGQSLVEVALFLPILIFMLVGVVEVSTLLNTQNKVGTSARIASGYGAANLDDYDRANWGEPAPTALEMGQVTVNSITQTLVLDPNRWDVWAIRAMTNEDGTDFAVFDHTHVYGDHQVVTEADWTALQVGVEARMLEEIQSWQEGAANLEVVATAPYYAQDTVLGVKIWQWVGLRDVRGLNVMRVGTREPFAGCPILPITIRRDQYSLYPTNWPAGVHWWRNANLTPLYPDDPVIRFPIPRAFQYPQGANIPTYLVQEPVDTSTIRLANPPRFEVNRPGTPLESARGAVQSDGVAAGDIFFSREVADTGGPATLGAMGWLTWDGGQDQVTLADSLTFPGDFLEKYPGSMMDMNEGDTDSCPASDGYPEQCGDGNGHLEIGEWLKNSTGNVNSVNV